MMLAVVLFTSSFNHITILLSVKLNHSLFQLWAEHCVHSISFTILTSIVKLVSITQFPFFPFHFVSCTHSTVIVPTFSVP